MNIKTLQFVSGLILVLIGIRSLIYDTPLYFFGIGDIIWGSSSIALAWLSKNGGDGKSSSEQVVGILYLLGIALVLYGLYAMK